MFRGAISHRRYLPRMGVAARLFAAAAVVLVGFAQFSESWHEMTVRHVLCAEHGELMHVASQSHRGPVQALRHDVIESANTETVEAHEHCGFVFSLQSSAPSPIIRVAVRYEPPRAATHRPADPALPPGRAFVLASAPKTSPPAA